MTSPLRGFATVNYYADDLDAAAAWYTELLGVEPYFRVPGGYIEFRIGDLQAELGIINSAYAAAPPGPSGVIMNWHVDDLEATLARLVELGAKQLQGPIERGPGFVTAAVVDPFGNILGIMYNAHYLEMLGARPGSS